jgi:uncharacterized protein (TIGR03067 family)
MIDGTWKLTGGQQDGRDLTDADLQLSSLLIEGDRHTVRVGQEVMQGTHTLNPDVSPMTIDASDSEGPFAGQTLLGIFQVEDDVFTVCFAAPGAARPTEFTTQDGQAAILHFWKRT